MCIRCLIYDEFQLGLNCVGSINNVVNDVLERTHIPLFFSELVPVE